MDVYAKALLLILLVTVALTGRPSVEKSKGSLQDDLNFQSGMVILAVCCVETAVSVT